MTAEREYLVKKIFPEIRALCRNRGVTFTEIDLRWGLTEEEATLGRVIRTCLEEVDRCRPHFIGMIGQRYGWVPEYHEIVMDPQLLIHYPWIEEAALKGSSVTEMEFIHGVLNYPERDDHSVFFYRRAEETPGIDNPERLENLIRRIEESGHEIEIFKTVEDLGHQVRLDLLATIDRIWPQADVPDEFQREERAHATFALSRRHAYIPNPTYIRKFEDWFANRTVPLVITGESGIGKSSLLSFLVDYTRRKYPDSIVVQHFIGASERSGKRVNVIRHIIQGIIHTFDLDEDLPEDPDRLADEFSSWLFRLEHLARTEGRPVLIAIDGLDRLPEGEQHLPWLPKMVPDGLGLLLSTGPGISLDVLRGRHTEELEVLPLTEERMRQSVIIRYLSEFHKGISTERLARISADSKATSPLFLRLVAEELRIHSSHESLDEEIDRLLGASDLIGVFDLFLDRLEQDFGRETVRRVTSLIAISGAGLSEVEIIGAGNISRLHLSQMLPAFDTNLIWKEGLLDFHYRALRDAVNERYLEDENDVRQIRQDLIAFLEQQPINRRTVFELLPQLVELGDLERLEQTLCSGGLFLYALDQIRQHSILAAWQLCGGLEKMQQFYLPLAEAEIAHIGEMLQEERKDHPDEPGELTTELQKRIRRAMKIPSFFEEAGFPKVALALYQRTLEQLLPSLPEDHHFVQSTRYGIAQGNWRTGNYQETEREVDVLLRGETEKGGEYSPEIIDTLNLKGILLAEQNRIGEADRLYRDLLENHADQLVWTQRTNLLRNMAMTCNRSGRIEESAAILHEVLGIYRSRYGLNHPATAQVMNNLASLHHVRDEHDQALSLLEEVSAIRRRIYGYEHPMTIRVETNIAILRSGRNEHEEAERILTELIPVAERVLGKEHPDLANLHCTMAGASRALGQLDIASQAVEQGLAITAVTSQSSHRIEKILLYEKACILEATGKREEAIALLERVINDVVKEWGEGSTRATEIQSLLEKWKEQ